MGEFRRFTLRLLDCVECILCRDVCAIVVDYALNNGSLCLLAGLGARCVMIPHVGMYFVCMQGLERSFFLFPREKPERYIELSKNDHFGLCIWETWKTGYFRELPLHFRVKQQTVCTFCGEVSRCVKLASDVFFGKSVDVCHGCWQDPHAWMWPCSDKCDDMLIFDHRKENALCSPMGCKRALFDDVLCTCGVEEQ